jgi:hypothetical protein
MTEIKKIYDVLEELRALNQTLTEKVIPLLERHDMALYSTDGTNGICKDVNNLKEKLSDHLENHLLERNNMALYSTDSTNGICKDVNNLKEKLSDHLENHWKIIGIILTVFGFIVTVINSSFRRN